MSDLESIEKLLSRETLEALTYTRITHDRISTFVDIAQGL